MHFLVYFAAFGLAALVVYNVVSYVNAVGTVADRLAAAWKGSMTIFALVWSTVVAMLENGMDAISSITGVPQFAQVGDAVKAAVSPDIGKWIVVGTLALPLVAGYFGRKRTLPQ